MNDQSRDLQARAALIKETAEKMARRLNLEFVIDPDKLQQFVSREIDEADLEPLSRSDQGPNAQRIHLI